MLCGYDPRLVEMGACSLCHNVPLSQSQTFIFHSNSTYMLRSIVTNRTVTLLQFSHFFYIAEDGLMSSYEAKESYRAKEHGDVMAALRREFNRKMEAVNNRYADHESDLLLLRDTQLKVQVWAIKQLGLI